LDSDGKQITYNVTEVSSLLIGSLNSEDKEEMLTLCDAFLSVHGEKLVKQLMTSSVSNIMRFMFSIGYYSAKLKIKMKVNK
jgi:hypothetical protein